MHKPPTSGTNRSFDVDFAHCDCEGTKHKSGLFVIAVRWKRKSNGKARFQCMRCKQSWSVADTTMSMEGPWLDANHPQERERRRSIHPDFDHVLAVNVKTSHAYRYEGEL